MSEREERVGAGVSSAIIASLCAADDGGDVEVRLPIIEVSQRRGFGPVVHRLDVAGRALAFDLRQSDHGGDDGVPELDEVEWAEPFERAGALGHLARWAQESPALSYVDLGDDEVWMLLAGVDHLRRRLGYPPHVVA